MFENVFFSVWFHHANSSILHLLFTPRSQRARWVIFYRFPSPLLPSPLLLLSSSLSLLKLLFPSHSPSGVPQALLLFLSRHRCRFMLNTHVTRTDTHRRACLYAELPTLKCRRPDNVSVRIVHKGWAMEAAPLKVCWSKISLWKSHWNAFLKCAAD